jgi:hypothetical protein
MLKNQNGIDLNLNLNKSNLINQNQNQNKNQINSKNTSRYIQLKDNTNNRIFRKSSLTRIILGTFLTTSTCFVYSIIFSKIKKLDNKIIKNYLKGSSILGFSFFSLNEIIFSSFNYLGIYSNFFINYSFASYILSKKYYRFLIRKEIMTWEKAIKFSHKCFLILCVIVNLIELYIYLYREIVLFDGEDVFDFYKRKFINNANNNITNDNEVLTIYDIQENFMAPIQLFNNIEKIKILERYLIDQDNIKYNANHDININNPNSIYSHKSIGERNKFRTVNIYNLVKDTSSSST